MNANFVSALNAAAAKAGVSIENLKVVDALLDDTWGRLVGFAFIGSDDEVVNRAAKFCVEYHRKADRNGVRQIMDRGVVNVRCDAKDLNAVGIETEYASGMKVVRARAVSTDYWPDMD